MGRPSKYNKETVELIKKFIRDGFTIRQACYGTSISEDTFPDGEQSIPSSMSLSIRQQTDNVADSVFEDANATVEEDDYAIKRVKNEIDQISHKLDGNEDLAITQQDFLNLIESAGKTDEKR